MTTITVSCDAAWAEGMCNERIHFAVATADEARTAAARHGWTVTRSGRDRCPAHTGRHR